VERLVRVGDAFHPPGHLFRAARKFPLKLRHQRGRSFAVEAFESVAHQERNRPGHDPDRDDDGQREEGQ